jgi:radical SAM enzyme (TIGR01210 family)
MCGHLARQTRQETRLSADDHVRQFQAEFKRLDFRQYPLLNLFNNGSFLNDNEIAPAARRRILQQINANPHIRMVVLESRPEFVSAGKIAEIRQLLPDKQVEIALGLELKNDLYRSLCLNKGFSLKQYDAAAALVCAALHLRTYVFLKPPFLSEQESIDEAVDTVEHAFSRGSTTVSLEACTVQDYTLVRCLYDTGQFKPPWLWSILEVVKRCYRPGRRLVVGMFRFFPSPQVVPFNCHQCSGAVMEALDHYNRTLDVAPFADLCCPCREKWQTQLTEPLPPLSQRIETALSRLQPHLRSL